MKKNCIYDNTITKIVTILASVWILKTFLTSLPYKFNGHEVTQHIFTTIGEWISVTIHNGLGIGFGKYAAYVIGTFELIASILLIIPIVVIIGKVFGVMKNKNIPNYLFAIGGLLSALLMTGAVFFHSATPLGTEIPTGAEGQTDGGSLFKAAVSIMLIGYAMFAVYFHALKNKFFTKK